MFPHATIQPKQISDLDPLDPSKFITGIKNMWDFCTDHMIEESLQYYFNLTGGYKAMGFTLSAFCYYISGCYPNSQIIYLHESAGTNLVKMWMTDTGPDSIEPKYGLEVEVTSSPSTGYNFVRSIE